MPRYDGFRSEYGRRRLRGTALTLACLALVIVGCGLELSVDQYRVGFLRSWELFFDRLAGVVHLEEPLCTQQSVIWEWRVPRMFATLFTGAALGVAGAAMQCAMKNVMADPYITGISSGASLGVSLVVVAGVGFGAEKVASLVLTAFVFSLVPVLVIIAVSSVRRTSSVEMILITVALSYVFGGISTMLRVMATDEEFADVFFWGLGSLGSATWQSFPLIAAASLLGSAALVMLAARLNTLYAGDGSARTLGVDAGRLRLTTLTLVSFMTAVSVAFVGPIGFIGLVAPHACRLILGSDNTMLFPASMAMGGAALLLADCLSKTVGASGLPVGVITALVGGPLFLYLLVRDSRGCAVRAGDGVAPCPRTSRLREPTGYIRGPPIMRDHMQIGIVGKPNVGKSTFFGAATMAPVEIANYPFTTIEPNRGVAYVRTPCPCKELGVECTPRNSLCVGGTRMVPVELLDVAGLVPDAWQGKGLGNQFLDDLRQADALVDVVDVSGSTDIEGVPGDPGSHDPTEDVLFLRREIDCWMREIIKNGFARIARQARMQGSKPEAILHERLAGLNVTEAQIKEALNVVPMPDDPLEWDDELLLRLCGEIRKRSKPMIAAMNKADISPDGNIEKVEAVNDVCVPTLAETELALKKAAAAGIVEYVPGDPGFKIKDGARINDGQRRALEYMAEKMSVFGGTGIQRCIEEAAFKMLDLITVYPVEDENKYTDHFGRVLPDAFLMPRGSTARDLAYKVHTDLGEKFIRAVNARTKRTVGADYELQDGDVIRIVANK